MSLIVWLPLNGNLNNQGIGDLVTTSSGGGVFKSQGKLGNNCLNLKTRVSFTCSQLANLQNFSVCFWGMTEDSSTITSDWQDLIGFNDVSSSGDVGTFRWETCYGYSAPGIHWHDNPTYALTKDANINYHNRKRGDWCHCCVVFDNEKGIVSTYSNGALVSENVHTGGKFNSDGSFYLGETNKIEGRIQDVRFYDHCLSPREVKEISKAQVLHYPLNQPERSQNLIADSKTITSGGNATGITSEYMSDGSLKIVATSGNNNYRSCRFNNNDTTLSNIEKYLAAGTNYTISLDIKVDDGTAFPTLFVNTDYYPLLGGDPNKHGVWQRVYQTRSYAGKTDNYGYMSLHLGFKNAIGTYYVKNFKLEVGTNTNPRWTPAITDTGNWGMTEYDTTGWLNNSTLDLSTQPTWLSDTPRHVGCYHFSNTQYIKNTSLPFKSLTTASISFWLKVNTGATNGWVIFSGQSDSEYLMASQTGPTAFYNRNVGSGTISYYEDGVKVTTPKGDKNWHHYVVTGVDLSSWTEFDINSYNSSWNIDCCYSDIRIYNTILTTDDIKELYNTPFSVANNGVLLIQGEVNEE